MCVDMCVYVKCNDVCICDGDDVYMYDNSCVCGGVLMWFYVVVVMCVYVKCSDVCK